MIHIAYRFQTSLTIPAGHRTIHDSSFGFRFSVYAFSKSTNKILCFKNIILTTQHFSHIITLHRLNILTVIQWRNSKAIIFREKPSNYRGQKEITLDNNVRPQNSLIRPLNQTTILIFSVRL